MRAAINGFGRIGRTLFKLLMDSPQVTLVAINDIADNEALRLLLQYDSVFGTWSRRVSSTRNGLVVEGREVPVYHSSEPCRIPWGELKPHVVIESSGVHKGRNSAVGHLEAGAGKVIVTSAATDADALILVGISDWRDRLENSRVISAGSCTTYAAATILDVLTQAFGTEMAWMSTVHQATSDQRLVDSPHKKPERGRAVLNSIIPTSTGASEALPLIFPHLKGTISIESFRVPIQGPSSLDAIVKLGRPATREDVLSALETAAAGRLSGILGLTRDPTVSADFRGSTFSAVVDTRSIALFSEGTWARLLAWYDNEMGYAARLRDLLQALAGFEEAAAHASH